MWGLDSRAPEASEEIQGNGVKTGAQGWREIVGLRGLPGTVGSEVTKEMLELWGSKETRVIPSLWRDQLESGGARGSRETVA